MTESVSTSGKQFAEGNSREYGLAVVHDPAELRRKAEACRQLAELAENGERKNLWLNRAAEWEQRATDAAKARASDR